MDIRVSIDRGGTFCDVIATDADGQNPFIFKLLSEDPANYADAPTEAIRRVLERYEGKTIAPGEKLDASRIASCRIGTTIATNALLTGTGERFAFATTKGFKDVCVIGDQSRPELFNLRVRKAEALHAQVVEIDERVTLEDYDLDPFKAQKQQARQQQARPDADLVQTPSGEVVRVLRRPDRAAVRAQLAALRADGFTSLAVCFMHAYVFPDHEQTVAAIARDVGFRYVTISSATRPTIKFVHRSNSTCSEAYLYPLVRRYVAGFQAGFAVPPRRVEFMCSDGGLRQADRFRGNEALLSGPAGGVVGTARCFDAREGTPVIGFDMGGTSTDVARYDGAYDYLQQTTIAGRTLHLTMLNIATVAAGGGSVLCARNGLLAVGPASAGAHPGPACYRKGGPLTVTDANLFLGRLVLSSFPAIFGAGGDQPLDTAVVAARMAAVTADFNRQTGQRLSAAEVAAGFLHVANETMSRPIRNATEARGYAPERHHLVSFGGAGGQHACALADTLGIRRVLVHRLSSLLSAHGIGHAALQSEAVAPYAAALDDAAAMAGLRGVVADLRARVTRALVAQGAAAAAPPATDSSSSSNSSGSSSSRLVLDELLVLKYAGTDTDLAIARPADGDYAAAFRATHLREFAFSMSRPIMVESVVVRGTGRSTGSPRTEPSAYEELAASSRTVLAGDRATTTQQAYFDGRWQATPVYKLDEVPAGSVLHGPALVIDQTQTLVVEPAFLAHILPTYVVMDKREEEPDHGGDPPATTPAAPPAVPPAPSPAPIPTAPPTAPPAASPATPPAAPAAPTAPPAPSPAPPPLDPVRLSVFAHRFMAIAEQMGHTLQRTSISSSIKERLDFSCAVFAPDGKLVANAPHIPIHLGSMQFAVQAQHRHWRGLGGTHLPDLTVVTPVFVDDDDDDDDVSDVEDVGDVGDVGDGKDKDVDSKGENAGKDDDDVVDVVDSKDVGKDDSKDSKDGRKHRPKIAFYVASRGHHTDIGGKGITSMMPESKMLWEEGIVVPTMKIVSGGVFLEDDVRALFAGVAARPGCSATRRLQDNLSDLRAQTSANQRGIVLLQKLCREYARPVVHRYMRGIQATAEAAVRHFFRAVAAAATATAAETRQPLAATDYLDDGTAMKVAITIDPVAGSAVFDFAGSGPQMWGNYNCPLSITHSAILYAIRCLVDLAIPLNQGCLAPCTIRVPAGSVLNPGPGVAICGSTLASQRVVDLVLRAFGRFGASQGCANSFGWGMGGTNPHTGAVEPGWNYGESIGGGVGAGAGYHGASGVHVHSTNTRQTDSEVVEKRTPVLVRRYGLRPGSGGRGRWRGGDGITREIEARARLTFSILSDRRVYRPYGMAGGRPGQRGENCVYKFSGEATPRLERMNLGGKAVVALEPGEYVQINTPGGGGYGRPEDDDSGDDEADPSWNDFHRAYV